MQQRILIVDAHPVYSQKLIGFFRGLTLSHILHAASAREALTQGIEFMPQIVLLSEMIPDRNAAEIVTAFRHQFDDKVFIIVQVGLWVSSERILELKTAGANQVIPRKEKNFSELERVINSIFDMNPSIQNSN